jgi:hypothetical protein
MAYGSRGKMSNHCSAQLIVFAPMSWYTFVKRAPLEATRGIQRDKKVSSLELPYVVDNHTHRMADVLNDLLAMKSSPLR